MDDLIDLFPFFIIFFVLGVMIVSLTVHYQKVNRFIHAFKNEKWEIREKTIQNVHNFLQSAASDRLISLLLKALNDPVWEVRKAAVAIFADRIDATIRTGNSRRSVVDSSMKPFVINSLLHALGDEQAPVRRDAVVALGKAKEPEIVPSLIKTLEDQDTLVRHNAVMALEKSNSVHAINPLLKLLGSKDGYIASIALETLVRQVQRIVFGQTEEVDFYQKNHDLYDPDLSHLKLQMPNLKEIIIYTESCEIQQIDALTRYAKSYVDDIQRKKRLKVSIYGNLSQFSEEFSRVFSDCKAVDVDIGSVIFGKTILMQSGAWKNPDCSELLIPLRHLREIIVYSATYDFHLLERFLTYAINYIGQKHLKDEVEVHIYGNPEDLEQNLRNNFKNMCKSVTVHRSI